MRRSIFVAVVVASSLFWRNLACISVASAAAFSTLPQWKRIPSASSSQRSALLLAPRVIIHHAAAGRSSTNVPPHLPYTTTGTRKRFPTFELRFVSSTSDEQTEAEDEDDDDEKMSSSSRTTTEELLKELNEKFDYTGRMPLGSSVVATTTVPTNTTTTSPTETRTTTAADRPQAATTITDFRCGFVVVMGAPNMGKSTLVNALLQQDLCITTARPQTTRHAILGILGTEHCQVCLVDTPGVLESPAYKLQQGMMDAVVGAFHDADVLLVVTDLFSTPIPNDSLFAKVQASNKPVIVAINKIDLASAVNPKSADKQQATAGGASENVEEKTFTVQEAVARWRTLLPNAMAIIPMSASSSTTLTSTASSASSVVSEGSSDGDTNDAAPSNQDAGVQALRRLLTGGPNLPQALRNLGRPIPGMFRGSSSTPVGTFITDDEARRLLPISPPLYDQEILTDRPERFIASELIRAALFGTLTKELPYCCEVRIQSFKEPKTINDAAADGVDGSVGSKKKNKAVIRIEADVLVERDSQKKIVIGQKAEMIKLVGILAREKLEDFFQSQVYLQLNVKVDKDWRRREDRLKEYGYLKSK